MNAVRGLLEESSLSLLSRGVMAGLACSSSQHLVISLENTLVDLERTLCWKLQF